MCRILCNAPFSGSPTLSARTPPCSSVAGSCPGLFKYAIYEYGGAAQGGPPSDDGLVDGNSRQTSLPSGANSSDIRFAQPGLTEGGRAQKN